MTNNPIGPAEKISQRDLARDYQSSMIDDASNKGNFAKSEFCTWFDTFISQSPEEIANCQDTSPTRFSPKIMALHAVKRALYHNEFLKNSLVFKFQTKEKLDKFLEKLKEHVENYYDADDLLVRPMNNYHFIEIILITSLRAMVRIIPSPCNGNYFLFIEAQQDSYYDQIAPLYTAATDLAGIFEAKTPSSIPPAYNNEMSKVQMEIDEKSKKFDEQGVLDILRKLAFRCFQ